MASLITDVGKTIILNRTYNTDGNTTKTAPKVFTMGTFQSTILASDVDLNHPIPISGTVTIDDCEVADFSDSVDATTTLNTTTFRLGNASINLTKDGVTTVNASTDKTVAPTKDFSGTNKEVSIWVYVNSQPTLDVFATTDCFTLRFGSDNANYYEWTKDKAFFVLGWNLIDDLTIANADSTTGSPTDATLDFIFIQITSSDISEVWAEAEVIMDDIKIIASENYFKDFTIQIIDETNLEVDTRMTLSSVESNGYDLSGLGIKNADSTRLLFAGDDFTSESKSETDEFIFIAKDKFL